MGDHRPRRPCLLDASDIKKSGWCEIPDKLSRWAGARVSFSFKRNIGMSVTFPVRLTEDLRRRSPRAISSVSQETLFRETRPQRWRGAPAGLAPKTTRGIA